MNVFREDDLAEIAKESGIQLNEGDDLEDFTQNVPKKKEKKKKGKAVEERFEFIFISYLFCSPFISRM